MSATSFRLEGRVAVVTGGYGVLGGSLASGLAAAGAHVAVLGRRVERAKHKVEEIRALGGTAMPVVADVRAENELVSARDEILRTWGRIDILTAPAATFRARATTTPAS